MALLVKQGKSTTTNTFRDNRRTETRITVYMPKDMHEQPVISKLISHSGVTVNIATAQFLGDVPQEGCFDLELRGTVFQIASALTYLEELNLEIKHQPLVGQDGW